MHAAQRCSSRRPTSIRHHNLPLSSVSCREGAVSAETLQSGLGQLDLLVRLADNEPHEAFAEGSMLPHVCQPHNQVRWGISDSSAPLPGIDDTPSS